MGIQRCENCGIKFNYMDLQKSLWSGYQPINCRNCGVEYGLKIGYRLVYAIPITFPVFFKSFWYKVSSLLGPTIIPVIFTYMLYVAAIAGLCPFIFRYKLRENSS